MVSRGDVLRQAMRETSTSQSELARLSGVRQPSISQTLSGRIEISDDQLDRLLSCLGFRLEVVRRPVRPDLTRSETRSWRLHRRLASHLDRQTLDAWRPTILSNVKRLRSTVNGEPHERNLDRWAALVRDDDLGAMRRALTGLDRDSIEMREVSPLGGLLSDDDRAQIMREPS